jgi:hypothetical protein
LKEREKIIAICCAQGDIKDLVSDFLRGYEARYNCQVILFISVAGDIASLVLAQGPSFKKEAIFYDIEVGLNLSANKILLFGHNPCHFRRGFNSEGKSEVYRQLFAAPEVIRKKFPQKELNFELYFINGRDFSAGIFPKRIQ